MIEAIYTSDTGLNASQSQLDNSANNIANLSTTSFKANRTQFQDLFYTSLTGAAAVNDQGVAAPVGTQFGYGVRVSSTDKQFGPGPLIHTDIPLNVAIDGNGFLQVGLPDGTTAYTRNGTLQVTPDGKLRNSDGFLIQPSIVIPPNTLSIGIATDGTVTVLTSTAPTTPQTVGQITLVNFANPPGLTALGTNVYQASSASGSPVKSAPGQGGTGLLRQGYLEGSNVDPTTELANLLIAQQSFVANGKSIDVASQMLSSTTTLLVQ
jgi:flagellar basal-body rod protein FlgG